MSLKYEPASVPQHIEWGGGNETVDVEDRKVVAEVDAVQVRVQHRHCRRRLHRKVDVRLPGKGNSNSHGARPVHLIITMIKWIRTGRLSIQNSLWFLEKSEVDAEVEAVQVRVQHRHCRRRLWFRGGLVFKAHRRI